MFALIRNETLKLIRRRRFMIVFGIMLSIQVVVAYSQYQELRELKNANWRADGRFGWAASRRARG